MNAIRLTRLGLAMTTACLPFAACTNVPETATGGGTTGALTTIGTATGTAVGTVGGAAVARTKTKLGMNAEGLFDNLTTYDIAWFQDLDATVVLRIPGGGDSKFAHPAPPGGLAPVKGWGLSAAEVDAYYQDYLPAAGESFDDTCAGPARAMCNSDWCHKKLEETEASYASVAAKVTEQEACDPAAQLDGMATCNFLEKVVLLASEVDLEIVYVANVHSGTAAEVFAAVDYLMTRGVKVVAVEMGNESYFPTNFDWQFGCYEARFTPIIDQIRSKYPTLPISLGSANLAAGEEPPGADSTAWNDALASYLASVSNHVTVAGATYARADAVTIHYYLTQEQCPRAWNARPTYTAGAIDDPAYYAQWSTALNVLIGCTAYQTAFVGEVAAAHARYPAGTRVLVTELNIKFPEDWGDTLVQGAWLFQQLLAASSDTFVTLAHNAVGNELFGLISMYRSRVDGSDPVKLGGIPLDKAYNVRRVGYWAYDLAAQALALDAVPLPAGPVTLGMAGKRSFTFANLSATPFVPTVIVSAGYTVTTTTKVVQGSSLYASAGYAAWNAIYAKTAGVPLRDFDSIAGTVSGTGNVLPAYAFGIVTYTITKK